MKHPLLFPTFLVISGSLLAQNPITTLSGNAFYRSDAPGSYTITCPTGTSAGVSALTKIANVPLLDPASVQYGIGVTFPWPSASSATPTLTGTLPQSYTVSIMGGRIYNAGVLAGTAYCNNAVATLTTTTAFTLTLNGITRDEIAPLRDRLTWALKANSVKLPRLGTTEQNTLPPQQAGNVIYNTDQQKLAVHNGTNWQYVGNGAPGASPFQNEKLFKTTGNTLWTVPTSVTLLVAEVCGGGSGGPIVSSNGGAPVLHGGGAGGYARGFMVVTPGNTLTLTVGSGGTGGIVGLTPGSDGGASDVYRDMINGIGAFGGTLNGVGGPPYGTDAGFGLQGGHTSPGTISYSQKTANQFVDLTKYGDGGTAYGAQPGGFGEQSYGDIGSSIKQGSFPGGGGGCGNSSGGAGGQGMIVIHW